MSIPMITSKIWKQGLPSPCPVSRAEVASVPAIDISGLTKSSGERSLVVKEIDNACRHICFFQDRKEGDGQAPDAASSFFELLAQEKTKYTSSDLLEPVWHGTGLKEGEEVTQNRRYFIKHCAHPLEQWIKSRFLDLPNYRFHSLAMEEKKEPVKELIDEDHPRVYIGELLDGLSGVLVRE